MRTRSLSGSLAGERGFTLIEMVVTMGIIILAAGFLVPALGGLFENRKLENAGTLIVSKMNEARNSAVTKKQTHGSGGGRDGLRRDRGPKGGDSGGFEGALTAYDPGRSGQIQYELHFADMTYDEIPEKLVMEEEGETQDLWAPTQDDVVLKFLSDGTIDFGRFKDVPSYEYLTEPVSGSDISIAKIGDWNRCYIDIRPTGRAKSKVEEQEL